MEYLVHWKNERPGRSFSFLTSCSETGTWFCSLTVFDMHGVFRKVYQTDTSKFVGTRLNNNQTAQDFVLNLFCVDMIINPSSLYSEQNAPRGDDKISPLIKPQRKFPNRGSQQKRNNNRRKNNRRQKNGREPISGVDSLIPIDEMPDYGLDDVIIKKRTSEQERRYHDFLDRELERYFKEGSLSCEKCNCSEEDPWNDLSSTETILRNFGLLPNPANN